MAYEWKVGGIVAKLNTRIHSRPVNDTITKVTKTKVTTSDGQEWSALSGNKWGDKGLWFREFIQPWEAWHDEKVIEYDRLERISALRNDVRNIADTSDEAALAEIVRLFGKKG